MNKVTTIEQVIEKVHDGTSIMIGGFAGIGAPLRLIEKLVKKGVKDLTIMDMVSGNPPGGWDIAPLFKNGQVRKYITSHIGTSPEVGESIARGECELQLFPMGTFMEKIRCGGYGLGGVLTPVGLGTLVENGKQKITVDGKEYLLETPLRADMAFIKGWRADKMGNVQYRGVSVNSNPIMASAADFTVVEVNEIVEIGEIDPMSVGTPGVFVKAVVLGNTHEEQEKIVEDRRVQTGRLK
jgi:acetate CoA/acetoacetate CoA-transferase alpha subunit